MNKYDKENVQNILEGHGDWFTARLFRLIAKSDVVNRARFMRGFPEETSFIVDYLNRIR